MANINESITKIFKEKIDFVEFSRIWNEKDEILVYISSKLNIDSHYTRGLSRKEYTECIKTIIFLHNDHRDIRVKEGKYYARLTTCRDVFNHEFSVAFFVHKMINVSVLTKTHILMRRNKSNTLLIKKKKKCYWKKADGKKFVGDDTES